MKVHTCFKLYEKFTHSYVIDFYYSMMLACFFIVVNGVLPSKNLIILIAPYCKFLSINDTYCDKNISLSTSIWLIIREEMISYTHVLEYNIMYKL